MKAIVQHRYGTPDVLRLEDVDMPEVKDRDLLIRVHAASVNPLDWHFMTGLPLIARPTGGILKPNRLIRGVDVAGRVEAVGGDVTRFKPGDEVFGLGRGSFAEYVSAHEDNVVHKPANIGFDQAAAVPIAALTALQALRDAGRLRAGQRVLINGASGGVGTFAVQIAKALGAEVTGVCSPRNVETVRALGADQVIDYTETDFTRHGDHYDLILDNPGNRSIAERRRILTPKGTLVLIGGPKRNRAFGPVGSLLRMLVVSRFVGQRMTGMLTKPTAQDLTVLAGFLSSGMVVPVIEKTYSLPETLEAMGHLGAGHAQGKLVIAV